MQTPTLDGILPEESARIASKIEMVLNNHEATQVMRRHDLVADARQEIWLAVVKAIPRWDASQGPLINFLHFRINGAVQDFLRRQYLTVGASRSKYRGAEKRTDPTGREWLPDRRCEREYQAVEDKADVDRIEVLMARNRNKRRMRAVRLYYLSGLDLKAVGRRLGVKEAAASQLTMAGVKDLRAMVAV